MITLTIQDKEFVACLQSEGTVIFLDTWYPTQGDLEVYPHNEMTSHHHWNLQQIKLPKTKYGVQEETEAQNVAAASMCFTCEVSRETEKGDNSTKFVPIVSAATEYKSSNVKSYILVLNEALYMKYMEHTLINPNQCQHLRA